MPYTITIDEGRPLLRLRLSGFWEPETFMRFAADFQAAVREITRIHRHFDTFADASGFQVQSVDVAHGFDYLKGVALSACPTARTAIIFDSALVKMQARREVLDASMQVFDTESEALAWLERVPA